MSIPTYLICFAFLGLIISLVVTAVREEDISRVWRRGLWAFVKLALLSAVAILGVEILYEHTIFTYPVVIFLGLYLVMGDRLWRWKLASGGSRPAADHSPDS